MGLMLKSVGWGDVKFPERKKEIKENGLSDSFRLYEDLSVVITK